MPSAAESGACVRQGFKFGHVAVSGYLRSGKVRIWVPKSQDEQLNCKKSGFSGSK